MTSYPISSLLTVWLILLAHAQEPSSGDCKRTVQLKPNKIILPKQAISAGADFIKRIQVSSLNECYFMCCEIEKCTTAIYKSKVSQECFLFDCRLKNSCIFTDRSNYDVLVLSDVHVAKIPSTSANLGDFCDHSTHLCATNHSVCSIDRCVCESGFVHLGTECVRSTICKSPDLQFQCTNSPVCVAIYDRCNGVFECPDRSDEVNCPSSSSVTSDHSVTPPTASLASSSHPNRSSGPPKQYSIPLNDLWLTRDRSHPSVRERRLDQSEEDNEATYTRWHDRTSHPIPILFGEPTSQHHAVTDRHAWHPHIRTLDSLDETDYNSDLNDYPPYSQQSRFQHQPMRPTFYYHDEPNSEFDPLELGDVYWRNSEPEEQRAHAHRNSRFESAYHHPHTPLDLPISNSHIPRINQYHVGRRQLIDQSVLPSNRQQPSWKHSPGDKHNTVQASHTQESKTSDTDECYIF